MVTTGALIFGDQKRHLDFSSEEHPIALQLGGSAPKELQRCTALASDWGYDEINLNCGCPSDRVQKGNFGASLMLEPKLVAQCVESMQETTDVPITVKHRLGLDNHESYDFVSNFVGNNSRFRLQDLYRSCEDCYFKRTYLQKKIEKYHH
jgi:tRNA-dihydrouridine synthase A